MILVRCGNVPNKRKSTSDVVVEAIDKISQAITPSKSTAQSHSHSPVRQIVDNRSKCYKQLSELKNLEDTGVLTSEEYVLEKEAVMATLKSLK